MKQQYPLFLRTVMLVLSGFLFCCCGSSKMPPGTCKPNGDLSIGTEALRPDNQAAIASMVQNKKIKHLEDLRQYLNSPTHGRGKDGKTRYDIWHYTMYSKDLSRNNFCMLAVESEQKVIRRMAYMTSSDTQQPKYYGDIALVHALSQVTSGHSSIPALQNAFKQVEKRRKPLVKTYHKLKPARRLSAPAPERQARAAMATNATAPAATQTVTSATDGRYSPRINSRGDLEVGASFLSWNNHATIDRMIKNNQFSTMQSIRNKMGCEAHAKGHGKDGEYNIWHYNWSSKDLLHHWTCLLYAQCQGNNVISVVYHAILEDGKNRFYGDRSLISKIENVQANWNKTPGNTAYPGLHKASHMAVNQSNNVVIPFIQRRGEEIKNEHLAKVPSVGSVVVKSLVSGTLQALQDSHMTQSSQSSTPSSSSSPTNSGYGTSDLGQRKVTTVADCTRCHGKGVLNNPYTGGSITCTSCNGSGTVTSTTVEGRSKPGALKRTQCSLCHGQKRYDGKMCPSCLGKGYQESFF